MSVKIDNVLRVKGRAVELRAFVGDIEIIFRRSKDSGKPKEASRFRDVQVLDKDTLYIRDSVFKKLFRQVNKIFSEVRPSKKRTKVLQEKLF